MNRIIFFVCKYVVISIFPFTSALLAQQAVSGRITDAEDGMPVPGASVFIANTTVGTTSSESGNYSLTVPGRGSFEIVVSHVGYQSVFYKIDTPQDTHQYDVALTTNEIEEVTIKASKNYRRRDVDLFWRMVLGEKPSKNGMEVLNPEKVYYYLNSDNVLKVTCKEPIEIINHKSGYRIWYTLQHFEHDYRPFETRFEGITFFEELTPASNFQKERWEKKRQEVYAVSVNRFLRALYREQIHEEGFVLAEKKSMDTRIASVPVKDVLQVEQGAALLDIKENLLLLCYTRPLTDLMIRNIFFSDISKKNITYPVVVELFPSQITVYPDGTYRGRLDLGEHNKYMGGLSSKVPVEYPEKKQNISYNHTSLTSSHLLNVEKNMTAQLEAYPQEKIHLHTDRDFFVPGEKIWFKAYVVDANSHLFPSNSQYVYVELISPADTLVNRVMIQQTDGMFHGNFPVSDVVPEGNYTLRAYTRYMENQGDDYFFKKNIRIESLTSAKNQQQQTAQISRNREAGSTSLSNRIEEDFDVSFYPEGGNLLEGVFGKVAFKAINKNGFPEMVTGKIIDENGAEMSSVETHHAGMGVFSYQPVLGKKIYLKCVNGNGLEKQFELPQPASRAYSLTATWRRQGLLIGLQKSVHTSGIPCYLLVHCRGTVLYFEEWDNRKDFITMMEEDLPAGVIQVVLFDGQMNPLSERLVFSKNDAAAKVDFQTDKEVYQIREKVSASLQAPSISGWAGEWLSHFSVAVTDDHDIAAGESTTILSSLLLSSELKGYIENPAYYLQDNFAMDLLMLTHGWRRYNIPEVVKGKTEYPQKPFQLAQEISGEVKSRIFNNPVPGGEILVTMKGGGLVITTTGENGSFRIQDLEFPDSTTFYIQALDRNGRDNVKVDMENESFPELKYAPQSTISMIPLIITEKKSESIFIEKAEQRAKYDDDIWAMHIEEVAITAPRIKKFDDPRIQFWANTSSDATITRGEIEKLHQSDVTSILSMLAGVRVIEDAEGIVSFYIRGNVNQGQKALVLIDGREEDRFNKYVLSANSIESIDIFKSGTMFGIRGANGVISFTTRRGGDTGIQSPKFNYAVHIPLGYQKPVEFYAPKYETLEAKRSVIPDLRTTIYWKPDIIISEEGKVTFEFYTSDFRTTYSVVIEGITSDGRIVRQVEKIRVE